MLFRCVLVQLLILSSLKVAVPLPLTSDYQIIMELDGNNYNIRCVEVKAICFLFNLKSILVFDLLLPGITEDIPLFESNLQDLRTVVQSNGIFLVGQCSNGEILIYFMEDAKLKSSGQFCFWKRFPLVNILLSQMQNLNSRRRIRTRFHRIYQYFLLEDEIHSDTSVFFYSMNMMSLSEIKGILQEGDYPQLQIKRMVFRKQQNQLKQRNSSQDSNNFFMGNNILKTTVSQNLEIAAVVDRKFRVAFISLGVEFEMPKTNDIEVELIDYLYKYKNEQEEDEEQQSVFDLVQIYLNDSKFELVLVFNYVHKSTGEKRLIVDQLGYSIKDNSNSIISFNRHTWNSQLVRLDVDGICASFFLDSEEIIYHDFFSGKFHKKAPVQLSFSEEKVIKTFHSKINPMNISVFLTSNRNGQVLRFYIKKCSNNKVFSYIDMDCISAENDQEMYPRNMRFVDRFNIKFEKKYVPQNPHDNDKDRNDYFVYWAAAIILVLCILYLHRNSHRIRISRININGESRRFFEQQNEVSEVKRQVPGRFHWESQFQQQGQFSEGILSSSSNQFEMQLLNFEQSHRNNQNTSSSPPKDNLIKNNQQFSVNERESIPIQKINFPFPKISKAEENPKIKRKREDSFLSTSNSKNKSHSVLNKSAGIETTRQQIKIVSAKNLNYHHQHYQQNPLQTTKSKYRKLKNKMLNKLNHKISTANHQDQDIPVNKITMVQFNTFQNSQQLISNKEEDKLWQRRETKQEINLKLSSANHPQENYLHTKSHEIPNNFLQFLNSQQRIDVEKQVQTISFNNNNEHSENVREYDAKNEGDNTEQFKFYDDADYQNKMNENQYLQANLSQNIQHFLEPNHKNDKNSYFFYEEEEEKYDFPAKFHGQNMNQDTNQHVQQMDVSIEEKQKELFEEQLKEQMDEFRYKGAAINQASIDLFSCFSQTAQQSSINIQPISNKKIKLNGSDICNQNNYFEISNFYKLTEDMSPECREQQSQYSGK